MNSARAPRALPPPRPPRAGGVLLLVLCVMAIILSTVFLAAATFRARARLTRDTLRREAVRDELLLCISNAVEVLLVDTNAIDHLGEPWAAPLGAPPLRCVLTDENARLPLQTADTNLLAAALAGAPESSAGGSAATPPAVAAASLAAWRDGWRADHGGEAPPSFAFYATALGDAEAAAWLGAVATPYGSGPVNLNTAPPATVATVLRACGAAPTIADAMAARLAAARDSGAIAGSVHRRTLQTLLLGSGQMPTEEEARVLAAAEPLFGTSTSLFRGHVSAPRPAVAIEFVYDRSAQRFLLWEESPSPDPP